MGAPYRSDRAVSVGRWLIMSEAVTNAAVKAGRSAVKARAKASATSSGATHAQLAEIGSGARSGRAASAAETGNPSISAAAFTHPTS